MVIGLPTTGELVLSTGKAVLDGTAALSTAALRPVVVFGEFTASGAVSIKLKLIVVGDDMAVGPLEFGCQQFAMSPPQKAN